MSHDISGYRLIPATLEAPDGLADFLHAIGEGENGFTGESTFTSGQKSLDELLAGMVDMAEGRGLPEGWVPATVCWLLDPHGRVTGMSRLRHKLTPTLLEKGGNIGYYIAKPYRGRGLGTFILSETLTLARQIGLGKVMVAANSDNAPSLRVIEANGGVFEDERQAGPDHFYRRYWIDLT